MLASIYRRQASLAHCRLLSHLINCAQEAAPKLRTLPSGPTGCKNLAGLYSVRGGATFHQAEEKWSQGASKPCQYQSASLGKVSTPQAQMVSSPDILSSSYYSFNAYLALLSDVPKKFPREHLLNSQVPSPPWITDPIYFPCPFPWWLQTLCWGLGASTAACSLSLLHSLGLQGPLLAWEPRTHRHVIYLIRLLGRKTQGEDHSPQEANFLWAN